MVTNRYRISFRSRRKNSKIAPDDWHRWRFCFAFRHFGTHFAESFRIYKSSWMMDPARSREMSSCSTIDLSEIRWSCKISSWIWSIISGVTLKFAVFWDVTHFYQNTWRSYPSFSCGCMKSEAGIVTMPLNALLWICVSAQMLVCSLNMTVHTSV